MYLNIDDSVGYDYLTIAFKTINIYCADMLPRTDREVKARKAANKAAKGVSAAMKAKPTASKQKGGGGP